MRVFYNRPSPDQISEELLIVQDVLTSYAFVYLDIAVFSLLFTLFLTPVLKTISFSILFFIGAYACQVGLFALIKKWLPC